MSEQCKDYHRAWGWFCTKEKGHGGRHRATIGLGEDAAVLGEWAEAPELSQTTWSGAEQQITELVKSFEAAHREGHRVGQWDTLRWVLGRIEAQLARAKEDPQADGYTVIQGLIVDIDGRMGVGREGGGQ